MTAPQPPPSARSPENNPPENNPPENNPPASTATPASQQLDALRVTIGWLSIWAFGVLFIVTVLAAMLLGIIIATDQVTNIAIEKMALAASVQVAFGMVIGYASLWIGLMMTWFGVSAAYELSGKLSREKLQAETTLKSASPGLLFALGGMVLIAVCLYKPIVYEETGGFRSRLNGDRGTIRDRLPDPNPLPPRTNQ